MNSILENRAYRLIENLLTKHHDSAMMSTAHSKEGRKRKERPHQLRSFTEKSRLSCYRVVCKKNYADAVSSFAMRASCFSSWSVCRRSFVRCRQCSPVGAPRLLS